MLAQAGRDADRAGHGAGDRLHQAACRLINDLALAV
jgi:hypothetical protein